MLKQQLSSSPVTSPTAQLTPTPLPSSTVVDPTANWKTYTNMKVGYELKFPPDVIEDEQVCKDLGKFPSEDNLGNVTIFPGRPCAPLFDIKLENNPNKLSPFDYWKSTVAPKTSCTEYGDKSFYICSESVSLEGKNFPLIYEVSKTVIAGGQIEAFRVNVKEGPGIYFHTVYIPLKSGQLLLVTSDDWSIGDQILSTFRFIDNKTSKDSCPDNLVIFENDIFTICHPAGMTGTNNYYNPVDRSNVRAVNTVLEDSTQRIVITTAFTGGWGGGYETETLTLAGLPATLLTGKDENNNVSNIVALINSENRQNQFPIAIDFQKKSKVTSLNINYFKEIVDSFRLK